MPRYFVTHWLPQLGPSLAWLVLAFRQAAFVNQCSRPEAIRPLPVRKLSDWAGLSHGQIWNLVQEPGWLNWFVRRVSRSTQRQESDVWGVRTAIPVAPHHLAQIRVLLASARNQDPDMDAYQTAQSLLRQATEILYAYDLLPAEEAGEPVTIQDLFEAEFGPLDSRTTKLLDELAGRITQPGNTIAISHYFIKRWRTEMTSGEAWLVHVLRTHIFSDRQSTSYLAVEGGKSQIARSLGVNTRSVRRWFAGIAENPLGRFIFESDEDGKTGRLGLQINMLDPIHPQDSQHYEKLLAGRQADKIEQRGGQKWTRETNSSIGSADKIGQGSGQNWTSGRTKSNKKGDKNEQDIGQNWTPGRTKLDALIDFNKKQNDHQLRHQQHPEALDMEGLAVGGWRLDEILQMAGVSPQKRQALANYVRSSEQAAQNFIAWVIYGYENRKKAGGINAPVLFALSRYAHNQAAPKYVALAALSQDELSRLIQNRFSPEVRQDLQHTLNALEANGFTDLLQPSAFLADIQLPADSPGSTPSLQAEAQENPWTSSQTASAEDVWDEVRQAARVESGVVPVSLWLDEQTLALSFLLPEQASEVERAIGAHSSVIGKLFPGYAFQLRTLEMQSADGQALPVVGIKSEKMIFLE